MVDAALSARVQRLLHGQFQVEDLTTLFLALRGPRSGGRQAVDEVGDFVAHRDERNKGIVTQAVRDFVKMSEYQMARLEKKTPLSLANLPPEFLDVLWATFRRLDVKTATTATGLRRKELDRALSDMSKRFMQDHTGAWYLAWPIQRDQKIAHGLSRYLVSKPAFDEEQLFEEFAGALISNKLLKNREKAHLLSLKSTIALYAIAYMHNCTLDLGNGTKASLAAMPNSDGKIAVCVTVPIQDPKIKRLAFRAPIFATSIAHSNECCAPELLNEPKPHVWEFDLELTNDKKLSKL
jgi:hypothetical protein